MVAYETRQEKISASRSGSTWRAARPAWLQIHFSNWMFNSHWLPWKLNCRKSSFALNSGERLQSPLAQPWASMGKEGSVIDVARSWEVKKEEKEYFRSHAVARDGSKCTIVQLMVWNWGCDLHKINITQKQFNTEVHPRASREYYLGITKTSHKQLC